MEALQEISISKIWEQYIQDHAVESRNALVEFYLPLVKFTAERLHARIPNSVERDDLHSAGILGLMDAIEKYDPVRNTKFESYCVPRIEGAILDDIRKRDWVPRLVRARCQTLRNVTQRLHSLYGHYPTDEETADELGMKMDAFYHFQRDANANSLLSLNTDFPDAEGTEKSAGLDLIANPKSRNPFSEVLRRELREYVKKGFSRQEKIVLILYYFKGMTLKEIGKTIGKSEARVCQLHSSIIARLREHIEMSALYVY